MPFRIFMKPVARIQNTELVLNFRSLTTLLNLRLQAGHPVAYLSFDKITDFLPVG